MVLVDCQELTGGQTKQHTEVKATVCLYSVQNKKNRQTKLKISRQNLKIQKTRNSSQKRSI